MKQIGKRPMIAAKGVPAATLRRPERDTVVVTTGSIAIPIRRAKPTTSNTTIPILSSLHS